MPRVKRFVLAASFMVAALVLLLYPFVSNALYERSADSTIEFVQEAVRSAKDEQIERMRAEAASYNDALSISGMMLTDPFNREMLEAENTEYHSLLNLAGDGVMGYIKIPCIDVSLPIYHGTDEDTLQNGAGHLEGSSLPVGGEGTHTIIAAHTGLSSAKMFTDLNRLEEGDVFVLSVLGEELCYEVDQVRVVEPSDVSELYLVEGEDYCTLLTCTPYGSNAYRLLVRGVRTEILQEVESSLIEAKDEGSEWMGEYKVALAISLSAFAISALILGIKNKLYSKKPHFSKFPFIKGGREKT